MPSPKPEMEAGENEKRRRGSSRRIEVLNGKCLEWIFGFYLNEFFLFYKIFFYRYDAQKYWASQRKLLFEGKLEQTLLIVQDFSALETTEKCQNHQDLILTIYKYNPTKPDNEEIS
jgi:hypothetical protein